MVYLIIRKTYWLCFYVSTFSACLLHISTGAATVWTSPVMPILKLGSNGTENPIGKPIALHEEALIGSLHSLGISFGGLLLGRISDVLGRKYFLISISVLEFSSFIVLALADKIFYFYITRLIQGVCLGCSVTVMPLFIAEISDNHNRGKFGTLSNFFQCFGNIYGFLIGSLCKIRTFTLLCAAPLLLSIPVFITVIPESPTYLVSKGKRDEAKTALRKFRHLNVIDTAKELMEIEILLKETSYRKSIFLLLVSDVSYLKSQLMSMGIFFFQQFSGLFAILGYLHTIFSLANIPLSQDLSGILVSVIQLLSIMLSTILIDRLGRKLLLLSSSAIVAVSLLLLGAFFQLKYFDLIYINYISWLPVASVSILIIGYGVGLGPVCFVFMSEVFPPEIKTKAASISVCFGGICSFIVTYTFPVIRDNLGTFWCFWILAVISILGFVYFNFCIIETKDRSFLEIQSIIKNK